MTDLLPLRAVARDAEADGIRITDFLSEDADLICPYFHQRFVLPDGRRFICAAQVGEAVRGLLVDPDAGSGRYLTREGASIHTSDLSLDGRMLFFGRADGIWQVDVETGREDLLAAYPSDGGYQCSRSLHRNCDGTLIAFGSNRDHPSGVKEGRVWVLEIATGQVWPMIERPFCIGHVQWSTSDPGLLMYCHETGGSAPQRMWLARTDGRHPGALFHDPGHPWVTHESFCRSGEWVVFIRHPEGIGMIRPDNTDLQLIDAPGAWHAHASTDASRIIYDTHGGEVRLVRRLRGDDIRIARDQLAGGGPHLHPCIAADDRTVIWTSSHRGRPCPSVADLGAVM